MSDVVDLGDLSRPRIPWLLRVVNWIARGPARPRVRFEIDPLLARARRAIGLVDLGDPSFLEPLGVLLAALDGEADLTAVGRITAANFLGGLLRNRLRLEALFTAHPEIADEPVPAPIIILGLPRTGTTHLFNLLALHPTLRSLPLWESIEPFPAPGERTTSRAEDPRLVRARKLIKAYDWVLPHMRAIHEIGPTIPHEDIQLLAMEFHSLLFEVSYWVPSYAAWCAAHDATPAYRTLRRTLQALQWLRGPRRWILKSPAHLEHLPALLAVFPDARVVQTHRDPVTVTASFCTMIAYGARMSWRKIDLQAIGRQWAGRIEHMLAASLRDRPRLPAGFVHDVRFDEFVADNLGTVAHVLDFAGLELDAATRAAMVRLNDERPRHAHGRIAYDLENFGLDAAELRAGFGFYDAAW